MKIQMPKITKNDAIAKYLDDDLDKFMKRWYKQIQFELTYSVTLRKWKRENRKLYEFIKSLTKSEYPGNISNICNLHIIMMKKYGFRLNIEDWKKSYVIDYVLTTELAGYSANKRRETFKMKGNISPPHSKKQALKELKLRGFIDVNDFDMYEKKMAHITTNANLGIKLYWPENFNWSTYRSDNMRDFMRPSVEIAHGLIGISGFTRILTPLDRR